MLGQVATDWQQWGLPGVITGGVLGLGYAVVRLMEWYLPRRLNAHGASQPRDVSAEMRANSDHDLLLQMVEMQRQITMQQAELTCQMGEMIRIGERQTLILERMQVVGDQIGEKHLAVLERLGAIERKL